MSDDPWGRWAQVPEEMPPSMSAPYSPAPPQPTAVLHDEDDFEWNIDDSTDNRNLKLTGLIIAGVVAVAAIGFVVWFLFIRTVPPQVNSGVGPEGPAAETFEGTDDATQALKIPLAPNDIVTVTYAGGTKIKVTAGGAERKVLVDQDQDFDGTVQYRGSTTVTELIIEAEGSWEIATRALGNAPTWDGKSGLEATGPAVYRIPDGLAADRSYRITYEGTDEFTFDTADAGAGSFIGQPGPIDDEVQLVAGTSSIAVDALGSWKITPS